MPKQSLEERERSLKDQLNQAVGHYRQAVRWLRDAKVYYNAYSQGLTFEGKAWKGSAEGELAKDSKKAYDEAISSVLYWRKRVDNINESLIDLAAERKKGGR